MHSTLSSLGLAQQRLVDIEAHSLGLSMTKPPNGRSLVLGSFVFHFQVKFLPLLQSLVARLSHQKMGMAYGQSGTAESV